MYLVFFAKKDSFKLFLENVQDAHALFECIRIMQEHHIRNMSHADSSITPEFINGNYQQGVNLIFERELILVHKR